MHFLSVLTSKSLKQKMLA